MLYISYEKQTIESLVCAKYVRVEGGGGGATGLVGTLMLLLK